MIDVSIVMNRKKENELKMIDELQEIVDELMGEFEQIIQLGDEEEIRKKLLGYLVCAGDVGSKDQQIKDDKIIFRLTKHHNELVGLLHGAYQRRMEAMIK